MRGKISRETREQIAEIVEFVMLSGLILIVISQCINGVCYFLGIYSVSKPEKKTIYNLSIPSAVLVDNSSKTILMKER